MISRSNTKVCDICKLESNTTDHVIAYGDWMQRHDVTVHYFCLLLSSNLPQQGSDTNGILGFLLRDIRLEIRHAEQRKCIYCDENGASIACHNCKKYFHQLCGHRSQCLFQFVGEFRSYCRDCLPIDEFRLNFKQNPSVNYNCYICMCSMGMYRQYTWIYAPCCNNGWVHVDCMRQYALASGYYLVCIWCRSKAFRDSVRLQGVFVPDRDAQWERGNAYADLHRGHGRCNMEICKCPKGRDFVKGAWSLIVCSLCGSFGAHNPRCLPDHEGKEKIKSFTCEVCLNTTKSLCDRTAQRDSTTANNLLLKYNINVDLQMVKMPLTDFIEEPKCAVPEFSEDESDLVETNLTAVHRTAQTEETPFNECSGRLSKETVLNPDIPMAMEVEDSNTESISIIDLCSSESNEDVLNRVDKIRSNDVIRKEVDAKKRIVLIEEWPILEAGNVIRTCTVKIDLNSPRFIDKSIEDICSKEFMSVIKDEDIVEGKTRDCAETWAKVYNIIGEFKKSIEVNPDAIEYDTNSVDLNAKHMNGDMESASDTTSIEDICDKELLSVLRDCGIEVEKRDCAKTWAKVDNIIAEFKKSIAGVNPDAVEYPTICPVKQVESAKASNGKDFSIVDNQNSKSRKTNTINLSQSESEIAMETATVKNYQVLKERNRSIISANKENQKNMCDSGEFCEHERKDDNVGSADKKLDSLVIEGWPEVDDKWHVKSTCTVKINLNSPRFRDKTLEDICSFRSMSLIKDDEKIERCTHGYSKIWNRVDQVISEFENQLRTTTRNS